MGADGRLISILIACGNLMTCELYSQALNQQSGFRVAGHATSIDEILDVLRSEDVDVALISTELADGLHSGFAALQRVHDHSPAIRPIVLFEQSETDLVVAAFRSGAKGVFCSAEEGFQALCLCVQKVHAGQIWASSAQLQDVLEAFSRNAPLRVVNAKGARLLTRREEDVVRLVQEGMTNRQIAGELQLSEHTIRNNLFRIFDKLGVSTRVELALYAVHSSQPAPLRERASRGSKTQILPPRKIAASVQ